MRSVPIHRGLSALASDYEAFIVDLWGVMHDGVTAFPEAVACLEQLKAHGKRVLILSNAPRRAAAVAARTVELGVSAELFDAVMSSGEAVWRWNGRVSRVDGQIDRATRTAGLVVEVDARARVNSGAPASRTPPELIPGLFVEVEVQGRRAPRVIGLPRGAIDQDGRVKLAVDGRLELRPVHVLRVSGDQAFVDEGLEDGELVVLSPMSTPVEGTALEVAAEPPEHSTRERIRP